MKSFTFNSLAGRTGRLTIEDEFNLIMNHKLDSNESIEVDFRNRLIRIYDDESWTVLPMDGNQQFDPEARIIDYIARLGE